MTLLLIFTTVRATVYIWAKIVTIKKLKKHDKGNCLTWISWLVSLLTSHKQLMTFLLTERSRIRLIRCFFLACRILLQFALDRPTKDSVLHKLQWHVLVQWTINKGNCSSGSRNRRNGRQWKRMLTLEYNGKSVITASNLELHYTTETWWRQMTVVMMTCSGWRTIRASTL